MLLSLHERFLQSYDTVGFVFAVRERYTSSTLVRLATHCDCRLHRAAVFALGFIGQFDVHRTLGLALQDEDDTVRALADTASRSVWNRDGTPTQRQRLIKAVRATAAEQYEDAVAIASALLESVPTFAEVWYQRGVARYQLGDLPQAIHDYRQCLELNAYHFVAATAAGETHLKRGEPKLALEAFRRVRIHPSQCYVQSHVEELERQLGE